MDDWLEIKCTCGDPLSPNIIHRTDGPCYQKEKKWVGLTGEEKHYLNEVLNLQGRFPIIDAIEAKLKEKNS